MKYVLSLQKNDISFGKLTNHTDCNYENEIEITEEQYNQINEFPLKLTIQDEKVVAWEKTEIEYEPLPEPPQEPTVEERLTQLEVLTVNNMSNQIENQILKGVI